MKKLTQKTITFLVLFLLILFFGVAIVLDTLRGRALEDVNLQRQHVVIEQNYEKLIGRKLTLIEYIIPLISETKFVGIARFNKVIDQFFQSSPSYVDGLFLVKNERVVYEHGVKKADSLVGISMRKDKVFKSTTLDMMTNRAPVVSMADKSYYGDDKVIIRYPIFKQNEPHLFWGSVDLVFNKDKLLAQIANLKMSKYQTLEIILLNKTGHEIQALYNSSDKKGGQKVSHEIAIYDKRLRFNMYNTRGFYLSSVGYVIILFCISSALIVIWFLRRFFKMHRTLKYEVESKNNALIETNQRLEKYIGEYAKKQSELQTLNKELISSIAKLEQTQKQLLLREKLASLADVITGITHEIETPISNALKLSSDLEMTYMQLNTEDVSSQYLKDFIKQGQEKTRILIQDLDSVESLILSFKHISSESNNETFKVIDLKLYVEHIINSLAPKLKLIDQNIIVDIPLKLRVLTLPSAISQLLTHLIVNSFNHGFKVPSEGVIHLKATIEQDILKIIYQDNGTGIEHVEIDKIFNPFYSTKKEEGHMGMGLHIVYHTVVHTLKGSIELIKNHSGFGVVMSMPLKTIASLKYKEKESEPTS